MFHVLQNVTWIKPSQRKAVLTQRRYDAKNAKEDVCDDLAQRKAISTQSRRDAKEDVCDDLCFPSFTFAPLHLCAFAFLLSFSALRHPTRGNLELSQ
jgi:hypothetical protein